MSNITPFLWFNGPLKPVVKFYTSVFKKNSKVHYVNPMSAEFQLAGQSFLALNGGPTYKFNEAVSFFVSCKDQKEVDYYWKKLSAGGKIQKCGWLKDKYGLSWQIIPEVLGDLIGDSDREKADRAIRAMLSMKKIDIVKLKKAHAGK
jgi:predicted 3-demethylubiquinone-9 3-methyltransferase (glyoxalase superfamily)